MNILVISSFLLFRETRFGGAKRLHYFVEELTKYGAVDLICIDGCKEIDRFKSDSTGFNYYKIITRKEKRDLKSRMLLSDLDVRANKYDTIDEVSKYLANRSYDAVLVAFPLALAFLEFVSRSNQNIIYIEDDLYFEKIREVSNNANLFSSTRIIKRFKYFQTLQFYRKFFSRIRCFICISEQEKKVVIEKFPQVQCEIIKYGIDLQQFPAINAPGNRSIGFIGNFNHVPNTDAVHFLFMSILNHNDDNFRVVIAGQNLPETFIKCYGSYPNVTFKRDLEKIDDFYKSIDIFVNPIVSGRGLRTKIIEAAAFGRPIISTPLGGEGLEDLEIFSFTNMEEFYSQIELLFKGNKRYSEIVEKNQKVVHSNYEISKIVKQLTSVMKIA
ncbi:MAG: glycosyltransferase family 4 protein [Chitinispirillaceae bacterium]|nr:glycosyltransferase family 4 protein [Chitinispirillaceae bacterium]